jgi:PLD-like domain
MNGRLAKNSMGVKLVHHNNESGAGGESPFCKVIIELVKNKNICIVCPYIGISLFEKITELANSWQLISDITEWIKSDRTNALRIKNFIKNNSYYVHHYPGIHAKVIMNENSALVSSANLTEKGMTRRVEMGVLIEDKEIVKEMHEWFSDVWNKSGGNESISIEHLEKFVTSIISTSSYDLYEPKISIPSKAPAIKAKLAKIGSKDIEIDKIIRNNQKSHQRLIEVIRSTSNRDWINSYFDLAKELIEFSGLKNDDTRLAMSLRKDGKIPISINHRWILKPLRPYNKGIIGLIMPLEYDSKNYDSDGVVFEAENYFRMNKIKIARWLGFERKNKIELSEKIKNYWKDAVMAELIRGKISPYRKFHEPVVYEAIMNLSYRNKILNEAFSEHFVK